MRDVLSDLLNWWNSGDRSVLATVVGTWSSAPRQPGATMLFGPDGSVAGSVSGGCIEGDVYATAERVIVDGRPVLRRYGVSDEDAMTVGLTCGGILYVYLELIDRDTFADLGAVAQEIESEIPVAVATVVEHENPDRIGQRMVIHQETGGLESGVSGSVGLPRADAAITDDVRGMLATGSTGMLTYGPDGQRRGEGMSIFVACYVPKPRMLVFGAIDYAAAVARLGTFLGYRVTVCDARPVFATHSRFPDVAEVVVDWPHRYLSAQAEAGAIDGRTVICVLTHDPKFDVPLLEVALRLPEARYVGAMGSRRTHNDRLARLQEAGMTDRELARLSSPIGLDVGARTPEETAVSIIGEIIAYQWGGRGGFLADRDGPIHHNATQ